MLSYLEQSEDSAEGDALDDLKKREQIKNIRVQRARSQEGLAQDRIKTAEIEGLALSMESHKESHALVADAVKGALGAMVQRIGVEVQSTDAVRIAEECRDTILRQIQESLPQ